MKVHESAEELAAYIAERKMKFPTKAKIAELVSMLSNLFGTTYRCVKCF